MMNNLSSSSVVGIVGGGVGFQNIRHVLLTKTGENHGERGQGGGGVTTPLPFCGCQPKNIKLGAVTTDDESFVFLFCRWESGVVQNISFMIISRV